MTALLTASILPHLFVVFHGGYSAAAGRHPDSRLEPIMTSPSSRWPDAICGGFSISRNIGESRPAVRVFCALPSFERHPTRHPQPRFPCRYAAAISLLGLGVAWSRYTGRRRWNREAGRAGLPFAGIPAERWYLDGLYRLLFIRFCLAQSLLWKGSMALPSTELWTEWRAR